MNLLSKIFFILISIALFLFLLFVTYITASFSSFQKPHYENSEEGLFELFRNENDIFTVEENNKTNTGAILVERISLSDKIIFSEGSVEVEKDALKTNIKLSPGVYVLDLNELSINYTITGAGFEVKNKGPGIFIVNNINPKKIIIFSINSLLSLDLKQYKTNEQITTIDLYPHTYLIFNPQKNIFVKNSDLLKISQIFSIGYFSDSILDNNIISDKFLNLLSLKQESSNELLTNSLLFIGQEYLNNIEIINTFVKSSFGFMPGENFIKKYSNIFINQDKKSSYYKNIIMRDLHKLLTDEKINLENINAILDNYNLLKEIDKPGAIEISNIINYYYKIVINSDKEINSHINLLKLTNKLNNNNINYKLESLIYLEKIFFKYDFLDATNFYNKIATFREQYFHDLNITTKLNDNNQYIENLERTDYLLFFLENLILSDSLHTDINTKDLLIILNDYVNIANSFYNFNDEKTKRTGLFTNSKILNKFITLLKNKYFLKERNKDGLLEINKDSLIIKSDIVFLEKDIDNVMEFYEDYKLTLKPDINNKDKIIVDLYSVLRKQYSEYFTALKNYEEYLVLYNQSKTNLLSINTINENDNTLVLSTNHALEYLQTFNGLQLQNITISLMDYAYCLYPTLANENLPLELAYCYKIDNLIIDGNEVSLLLHPFEKNKIDEIYINTKVRLGSYKLDETKAILDEKKKTSGKDKDKYEFKNFLIDTFGNKNYSSSNNTSNNSNDTVEIEEEEVVVKVFKRNKLLGESGDFSSLEGFIDINYSDLKVKKLDDDENYSIYIELGTLNIDLGEKKTFYGEITSDYIFSPSHSFINPKIKLINKKEEKSLLLGNYIYINGEYGVNSIEDELKELFKNYDQISGIINDLNSNLGVRSINITYSKDTNQTIFELEYKGNSLTILLDNLKIIELKYNDIEQLESTIHYTDIPNILNTIINPGLKETDELK